MLWYLKTTTNGYTKNTQIKNRKPAVILLVKYKPHTHTTIIITIIANITFIIKTFNPFVCKLKYALQGRISQTQKYTSVLCELIKSNKTKKKTINYLKKKTL